MATAGAVMCNNFNNKTPAAKTPSAAITAVLTLTRPTPTRSSSNTVPTGATLIHREIHARPLPGQVAGTRGRERAPDSAGALSQTALL